MTTENTMILLVEDNADDQLLVVRALRKNNISDQVYIVNDGAEALDFLFCSNVYTDRDPQTMPLLVLMDLNLSGMNLLDTLRSLRSDQRTRLLPVVLLAAYHESEMVLEAYKAGANYHLRKPTDYFEFMIFALQLGQYWLRWSVESFNQHG